MRSTFLNARGGGAVHVWFTSANKISSEGEQLNTLLPKAVSQVLKQNKYVKSTDTHDSGSENEPENQNLENLNVGGEYKAE